MWGTSMATRWRPGTCWTCITFIRSITSTITTSSETVYDCCIAAIKWPASTTPTKWTPSGLGQLCCSYAWCIAWRQRRIQWSWTRIRAWNQSCWCKFYCRQQYTCKPICAPTFKAIEWLAGRSTCWWSSSWSINDWHGCCRWHCQSQCDL